MKVGSFLKIISDWIEDDYTIADDSRRNNDLKNYKDNWENYKDDWENYKDDWENYEDDWENYEDDWENYEDGWENYENGWKNYENGWGDREDNVNPIKPAAAAELPRNEMGEYPNIKRFNDEVDQKIKELEDELANRHGSETWLRNLWLRWLFLWKSGWIWLMALRVSPKWWGGNVYFESIPSFYAISKYFNNFTSINQINWKYPASLLLTYYTLRVALLEQIPSGNTRNLYLMHTALFRRALRIFGVGDTVIRVAGALGRAVSKKIWKR